MTTTTVGEWLWERGPRPLGGSIFYDEEGETTLPEVVGKENSHFKVSMAHVKPFERRKGQQEESVKNIHASPAWSFDASGALAPSDSLQKSFNELTCGNQLPQEGAGLLATQKCRVGSLEAKCMTVDALKREWRRVGTNLHDKLMLLLALSPGDLAYIFKVELPPSILADVIEVLWWWKRSSTHEKVENSVSDVEETPTDDITCKSTSKEAFDAHIAFQILNSLCVCGRFSLSLKLAGERAQSLAILLIDHLVQCLEKKEISIRRASNSSCMSSPDQKYVFKGGFLPEGSKANGLVILKEQTLSMDDLKQLASFYTCM
eukprot:c15340_g1_i1 orf=84-1037(-)